MKYDDKIRSEKGLAVCLRDMGNGKSRIFIDDVNADKSKNPINWEFDCSYTFTPEFENEVLENMALEDEVFEKIGVAVVARLLALKNSSKK